LAILCHSLDVAQIAHLAAGEASLLGVDDSVTRLGLDSRHGALRDVHGASFKVSSKQTPEPALRWWHVGHAWFDHMDRGLLCVRGVLAAFILCVMVSSILAYHERSNEVSVKKGGLPADPDGPREQTPTADGLGGSEARRSLMALLKEWLTDPTSSRRAWMLTGGVCLHWIIREASWAYILSANHAEVTNSLTSLHESANMDRVYKALLVMLLWDLFWSVPLFHVIDPLVSTSFSLDLRGFLTGRAMRAYLNGGGNAFYFIKVSEGKNRIDNPDQRIAEDVDRISDFTYGLYSSILSALFGCAMWTHVVFELASSWVVIVCLGSCILRTLVAWYGFVDSLVMSRRRILHTGADLRYGLTRVRDSAEEIALGQGAQREHVTAVGLFHRQVNAVWSNRLVHVRYGVSVGILEHFPALVLWLLMMNDIVHGSLGIGDALRVHFAYDQIGKVLGFVIQNFDQCTNLQADADRLHQLLQACDGPNNSSLYQRSQISLKEPRPGEAFAADELCVHPPDMDGAALGGVNFTLTEGQALLLMGPSGVGKTAILRAVAGLWRNGTGAVRRPGGVGTEGIRFIPNRVYLPQGTLIDLVKYPLDDCCQGTAEAALRRANLGHLIQEWGLGTSRDWKPLLSPGEQQRVGFARLFVALTYAPKNSVLAVLDEATGALDVATERLLYSELRSELRSGGLRGVLSVGHRVGLRDFHDALLCIGEHDETGTPIKGGKWLSPSGPLEWQLYTDLLVLPPPAR